MHVVIYNISLGIFNKPPTNEVISLHFQTLFRCQVKNCHCGTVPELRKSNPEVFVGNTLSTLARLWSKESEHLPAYIRWGIKMFAPFKAAGEDATFSAMLHGSIGLIDTPTSWNSSVFIPKLGQTNYTIARAFRPISLTTLMPKTLEKLVDSYLSKSIVTSSIRLSTEKVQGNIATLPCRSHKEGLWIQWVCFSQLQWYRWSV